jgi:hypothetical protein
MPLGKRSLRPSIMRQKLPLPLARGILPLHTTGKKIGRRMRNRRNYRVHLHKDQALTQPSDGSRVDP